MDADDIAVDVLRMTVKPAEAWAAVKDNPAARRRLRTGIGVRKLTAEQVIDLRRRYREGLTGTAVEESLELGVSPRHVRTVIDGLKWKNVGGSGERA